LGPGSQRPKRKPEIVPEPVKSSWEEKKKKNHILGTEKKKVRQKGGPSATRVWCWNNGEKLGDFHPKRKVINEKKNRPHWGRGKKGRGGGGGSRNKNWEKRGILLGADHRRKKKTQLRGHHRDGGWGTVYGATHVVGGRKAVADYSGAKGEVKNS